MERLSGLYRLAACKMLSVFGVGLTIGLNLGAIDLVDDLKNNIVQKLSAYRRVSG